MAKDPRKVAEARYATGLSIERQMLLPNISGTCQENGSDSETYGDLRRLSMVSCDGWDECIR